MRTLTSFFWKESLQEKTSFKEELLQILLTSLTLWISWIKPEFFNLTWCEDHQAVELASRIPLSLTLNLTCALPFHQMHLNIRQAFFRLRAPSERDLQRLLQLQEATVWTKMASADSTCTSTVITMSVTLISKSHLTIRNLLVTWSTCDYLRRPCIHSRDWGTYLFWNWALRRKKKREGLKIKWSSSRTKMISASFTRKETSAVQVSIGLTNWGGQVSMRKMKSLPITEEWRAVSVIMIMKWGKGMTDRARTRLGRIAWSRKISEERCLKAK